jgi:hypothetical protein
MTMQKVHAIRGGVVTLKRKRGVLTASRNAGAGTQRTAGACALRTAGFFKMKKIASDKNYRMFKRAKNELLNLIWNLDAKLNGLQLGYPMPNYSQERRAHTIKQIDRLMQRLPQLKKLLQEPPKETGEAK